jgi:IS1 family transposase
VGKRGKFGFGNVWSWIAIDADTKPVPSFLVGDRDSRTAKNFIADFAERLTNRVQLTTDGPRIYVDAVEEAFGTEIDYAMLVMLYGADPKGDETRYSPAECIGCQRVGIMGAPDAKHISTSFVERQNLTMRMKMRRFTP